MFGISHQKAGLNWPGRHKAWSRERAIADAWRFWLQHRNGKGVGARGEGLGKGEHAKWRRITGITEAVEGALTAKERKKGLRRLIAWIEKGIKNSELRIQNGTDRNGAPQRRGDAENGKGSGFRVEGLGNGDEATELSLTTAFGRAVEAWAGRDEHSIESLCVNLQISRARLTMLTKEYCGLTAQELVDGFKIRRVKRGVRSELAGGGESGLRMTKGTSTAETQRTQRTERAIGGWGRLHGQPTANRGCPWHTVVGARAAARNQ